LIHLTGIGRQQKAGNLRPFASTANRLVVAALMGLGTNMVHLPPTLGKIRELSIVRAA
jgi:hypothetical protein